MTTIFCPYTGRDIDEAQSSLEHVIPGALGGAKTLSVLVDKVANNTLGSTVDAAACGMYAFRRVKHDLKGHSGATPVCQFDVSFPDLGGHEGRLEITAQGGSVQLRPRVTREQLPDGRTSISVEGDPTEASRIFENIRKAHEAKGRRVELNGNPIPQRVEQPRMSGRIAVDLCATSRFALKVALGVGHYLWGSPWSRGPDAALLRRGLWSTTVEELNAVGIESGVIGPDELGFRFQEHEHAFVWSSLPEQGAALALLLFGDRGHVIRFRDSEGAPAGAEVGALVLDAITGALRRYSAAELYSERRLVRY